jgi:translation initiation factor IF-3
VPCGARFFAFNEGRPELDTDRDWAHLLRPRRRFDQRPQEPTTRINDAIRVPQIRLIGADGEQIGIKSTDEALKYAWDMNLDLVEVAPDAKPPVCRVMDYSKYKYEQEQKAKLARKHQSTITIKEIKLRPKIDPHDYATKKGHVVRFLKNRDKVKVTIMFRGREMTHPDRGRQLLLKLADEVQDLGIVESAPLQDGRNMVMMLAPHKNAPVASPADAAPEPDSDAAAAPAPEGREREGRRSGPGRRHHVGDSDAEDENQTRRREAAAALCRRQADAPPRVQVAPARAQVGEAAAQEAPRHRRRRPGHERGAAPPRKAIGETDGTSQAQRSCEEEAP